MPGRTATTAPPAHLPRLRLGYDVLEGDQAWGDGCTGRGEPQSDFTNRGNSVGRMGLGLGPRRVTWHRVHRTNIPGWCIGHSQPKDDRITWGSARGTRAEAASTVHSRTRVPLRSRSIALNRDAKRAVQRDSRPEHCPAQQAPRAAARRPPPPAASTSPDCAQLARCRSPCPYPACTCCAGLASPHCPSPDRAQVRAPPCWLSGRAAIRLSAGAVHERPCAFAQLAAGLASQLAFLHLKGGCGG